MNQLKVLVAIKKPTAVILSETHITEDISEREINMQGYNIIRCNSHSRHTGGVVIYVRKNTRFKQLKNFNVDNELWLLGIELKMSKSSYRVYGVYNRCSETKFIQFFFRLL